MQIHNNGEIQLEESREIQVYKMGEIQLKEKREIQIHDIGEIQLEESREIQIAKIGKIQLEENGEIQIQKSGGEIRISALWELLARFVGHRGVPLHFSCHYKPNNCRANKRKLLQREKSLFLAPQSRVIEHVYCSW